LTMTLGERSRTMQLDASPEAAVIVEAIRAALERYAATLESLCREAPYNWFNFYDFWAEADASPSPDAAS